MLYGYPKEPSSNYKKVLVILAIVIGLLLSAFGVYKINKTWFKARTQPSASQQTTGNNVDVSKIEGSLVGRYLFNGTTVWARAVEKYARGDYAQPFNQLDTFNKQQYDAWTTNLECPITNNIVPYDVQVNNLVFNCRPEFLPASNKYFDIYNLANNHTDNQNGHSGIISTRRYLDESKAQYFGNFDPTITEDICEVLALPVKLSVKDQSPQKASLPVAFCGWHYFNYFRGPSAQELAVVKQYAEIMPVFGFAEMGLEYRANASSDQVQIAHQLIDSGLDMLLANNPHWVQNSEAYKGKLIVYSLGNFIFDQLDTETNRSASIDMELTADYDQNLQAWLKLGQECSVYKDDCLKSAKSKGLHKVDFKIKYSVVAGLNGAGKITHKADAATQSAVEQRLNWSQTLKDLGL